MLSSNIFAALAASLLSTGALASNAVTATASAGFQSAQLVDSDNFSGLCTYPAPSYQPVCAPASQQQGVASSDFNFKGQIAQATSEVNGPALLRVAASVSATAPPVDTLKASSSASFNDTVTFNVANLEGQSVLVFVKYTLSGSGTTAFSSANSSGQLYGSSYLNMSLGTNYASDNAYSAPGYSNGYFSPNFQYSGFRVFSAVAGKSQDISFSLNATCSGSTFNGGFGCASDASFGFLGIAALTLPNGTEISNYSVASLSGFDYVNATAPVPEPEISLMLLAGLAVIAVVRRRRSAT